MRHRLNQILCLGNCNCKGIVIGIVIGIGRAKFCLGIGSEKAAWPD